MQRKALDPRILAITAVMTAIVFVLTRLVQLGPTPVGGYIHLGDVGVFFSAFALGPWVGAVAGGLGTALADWTSPFAQWGIASLLIHGTQGWVAGWISARWQDTKGLILASVVGGVIVVVGYLIAGTFFYTGKCRRHTGCAPLYCCPARLSAYHAPGSWPPIGLCGNAEGFLHKDISPSHV